MDVQNETRFFSFPTEVESIVDVKSSDVLIATLHKRVSSLYDHFENDFFYLPSGDKSDLKGYLNKRYHPSQETTLSLCDVVFSEFDQLIDASNWDLAESEVIDFFWYRARKEVELLEEQVPGDDYVSLANLPNAKTVSKYLMSQFALDYLTEASPLARMLPGTYGEIQMAIFKIVSDEYGGGDLKQKHSVLFQNTLNTLNMSDDIETYRPHILPSVYMYMCYVNRITTDKRLFLRFLGFLFVYEACLIYPTQQQGMLLRKLFNNNVDTDYFDLHVEIDQGHGVWCVEKVLIPTVLEYGVEAAREILRGYHETLALLSMCDYEMMNAIKSKNINQFWETSSSTKQ